MAIIKSRTSLNKYYKQLMKNALQMPSIKPRAGVAHVFHTVSNPYIADLKKSAGLSVLTQLNIDSKTLRSLTKAELNLLLGSLQNATSKVRSEWIRKFGQNQ